MKTNLMIYAFILLLSGFSINNIEAQGTWTPLTNAQPHTNGGGMFLLSDGSVLSPGNNALYDRLTPDIHGSYVNGTWSTIAPMHNTRLYYSSQLLKNGNFYVAGGEFGSGQSAAEVYNPLTNVWTTIPWGGGPFADGNSEILPDGKVLQGVPYVYLTTAIYNPLTNSYTNGPNTLGNHNESAWVKLPDNSILFIDRDTRNSERYIPSLNQWIADATLPVDIYAGSEMGAGFLLPDGRAFFLGGTGHTVYYTPSGNTNHGSWVAGPDIPNGRVASDAPGAMMANGKILCDASRGDSTFFYEFNYLTNSFASINAPGGSPYLPWNSYLTTLLDLPDGSVLYNSNGQTTHYIYSPNGIALASGKPGIGNITQINSSTFKITGTLFNGISEGAAYGDDWQMATNYPVIRLTSGTNVYYARTFNWNSTGVQRGNLPDTTQFTLPAGLPVGTYSLVVTANGISSNLFTFSTEPLFTGAIKGSPFCSGTPVSVPYTTYGGTYFAGNVFTAQLSDPNGSFASPVPIGVIRSTISGTISATIPSNALAGSGYRIRVVSSNPVVTGTISSVLTIIPTVTAGVSISASTYALICPNTSVTFTATPFNGGNSPSYQWKKNNVIVGTGPTYTNASWVNHDEVNCIMTSNASCVTGNPATSNSIFMNVASCSRLKPEMPDEISFIEVLPNPSGTFAIVTYTVGDAKEITLTVSDITGRIIFSKVNSSATNSYRLETADWSEGVYFIQLTCNDKEYVRKLIVQH